MALVVFDGTYGLHAYVIEEQKMNASAYDCECDDCLVLNVFVFFTM